jgi:hypothetical protein
MTAVLLATGNFFAHRPLTRTRKLLRRERQIDQFQPEPLSGVMVPKQQRIMRFGTRHAPF